MRNACKHTFQSTPRKDNSQRFPEATRVLVDEIILDVSYSVGVTHVFECERVAKCAFEG